MTEGLKEIRRVLVPGGVLIGTVPYHENLAESEVLCPRCNEKFHRWGHQQSFDESGMRSVLREYFSVRKIRPIYFPTWNTLDWKGKLSSSARLLFSFFAVYSSRANLLFIAAKAQSNHRPQ
jgi:SAM-dependent methyltransferase